MLAALSAPSATPGTGTVAANGKSGCGARELVAGLLGAKTGATAGAEIVNDCFGCVVIFACKEVSVDNEVARAGAAVGARVVLLSFPR